MFICRASLPQFLPHPRQNWRHIPSCFCGERLLSGSASHPADDQIGRTTTVQSVHPIPPLPTPNEHSLPIRLPPTAPIYRAKRRFFSQVGATCCGRGWQPDRQGTFNRHLSLPSSLPWIGNPAHRHDCVAAPAVRRVGARRGCSGAGGYWLIHQNPAVR